MAFQELPQAEPSRALTAVLMQQAAASAQPKKGIWASVVGFLHEATTTSPFNSAASVLVPPTSTPILMFVGLISLYVGNT